MGANILARLEDYERCVRKAGSFAICQGFGVDNGAVWRAGSMAYKFIGRAGYGGGGGGFGAMIFFVLAWSCLSFSAYGFSNTVTADVSGEIVATVDAHNQVHGAANGVRLFWNGWTAFFERCTWVATAKSVSEGEAYGVRIVSTSGTSVQCGKATFKEGVFVLSGNVRCVFGGSVLTAPLAVFDLKTKTLRLKQENAARPSAKIALPQTVLDRLQDLKKQLK